MTRGEQFLEELRRGVLLGDGAMGTALYACGAPVEGGFEQLNLTHPELVHTLHSEYIAAGSRVIETNTFSANRPTLARHGVDDILHEIIIAGVRLARDAAGASNYVAGSVGPLPLVEGEPIAPVEQTAFFAEQITALLDGDIDLLIFETFTDIEMLCRAIATARTLTAIPIVAQLAFRTGGKLASGISTVEVLRRCRAAGADVVGANCGQGAPAIIAAITSMASEGGLLSAYINAGFPEQVEGRLLYLADTSYLISRVRELITLGVRLIGGCCGTTPEVIRAIAQALPELKAPQLSPATVTVKETAPPTAAEKPAASFGKFPLLVELDPPMTPDIAPVLQAAHELELAGATGITLADNPLASLRVDTLTVTGMLAREVNIPLIPHLTGRDRNRLALQSTVLGAHVLGIRALLCVTGDPIRMYEGADTSGVFDVTSVGLTKLVDDFNAGHGLPDGVHTSFAIGVAFNPNVRTIAGQISKLQRKIEAGATFALTQPVFSQERLELMYTALAEAGITIPIYVGVMPLSSARNAEFLHHEVPGMVIPDEIRARMATHAAIADQRQTGIEISLELLQQFAPQVSGFYFITPRNRVSQVIPLLQEVQGLAGI